MSDSRTRRESAQNERYWKRAGDGAAPKTDPVLEDQPHPLPQTQSGLAANCRLRDAVTRLPGPENPHRDAAAFRE